MIVLNTTMETPEKYETISDFQISIKELGYGWETISLSFDEIAITFSASYIGPEPLSSLIEAVEALDEESVSGSNRSRYFIDWISEPGHMSISLSRNLSDDRLSLEIKVDKSEEMDDNSVTQWDFVMNYALFRQAVVKLTISMLNNYGICGFNHNWDSDNGVLPIGSLLTILGVKTNFDKVSDLYKSDILKELALLTSIITPTNKQ